MKEAPTQTGATMDPNTLIALKGSIAKWEAIVAGTGKDLGDENCPLCHMFHGDHRKDNGASCEGCPVRERTGKRFCRNTPIDDYHDASTPEQERKIAQKELDFLKSLLPKEAA